MESRTTASQGGGDPCHLQVIAVRNGKLEVLQEKHPSLRVLIGTEQVDYSVTELVGRN